MRVATARIPLLATVCLCSPLAAQGIVSPNDRQLYEGSTYTAYPLGRFNTRVQQLHQDLGTSARTLAGHAYRRDAAEIKGSIAAFSSEISVTLAMSPKTPATASAAFADNLGGAAQLVLPRAKLSFPATDRPATDPAPVFALLVPYTTPFAYPAGGGVLCVDVVVHTNDAPSGKDKDFLPYLDAHELFADGRNLQPGYRFGTGCKAPAQTTAMYGDFVFTRTQTTLALDVAVRYGVPTDAAGDAFTALLIGSQPASQQLTWLPGCTRWSSAEHPILLGKKNDALGHLGETITGLALLDPGTIWYVQPASAQPATSTAAFGDATRLTVPPAGPLGLNATRIANGSDRTAPTGTIATQVAVVKFI